MPALVLGIDIGTSGARTVALDEAGAVTAQGSAPLNAFGNDHRDPQNWWSAVEQSLRQCLAVIDPARVRAIAVDGTSGTVLPVDASGAPLAQPLMYNDPVSDQGLLARIEPLVPLESAAHGPTSGLAKMLVFQAWPGVACLLHQADWIAGRFSGRFDLTDENNALKSGYDPMERRWPDWIALTGMRDGVLPAVVPPGTVIDAILPRIADAFGIPKHAVVVAGTTDGCASFLATEAARPGDAVTAIGSTLTLKLLSDRPVFAPGYGVYSHRLLGMWLAGGASNTGGRVLARYFDGDAIAEFSKQIDPAIPSGLDYYPLLEPGERFPLMDPRLPPRLEPRPADDATFLKGMLEGIAAIEALGYRRLAELGAPRLATLRSVGGGAGNPQWTAIRKRALGVPFEDAASSEAAAGAARLALAGARQAGLV